MAWLACLSASVLCGCQTGRLPWQQAATQLPEQTVVAAKPHHSPELSAAAVAPKPAQAQSGSSQLLAAAMSHDNANRMNPRDRRSLDEARRGYEAVLRQFPNEPTALHRLGTVADREGNFSEAEQYYLAAWRITPDNCDLLGDLGYSYLLQQRYDDSERVLNHALEINPGHVHTRINLGTLYARRGEYGRALATLRTAVGEQEAEAIMARVAPASPPPTAGPGPGLPPDAGNGLQPNAQASLPQRSPNAAVPPPPAEMNEATRKIAEAMARERAIMASQNPPRSNPRAGVAQRPAQLPPEQWNNALSQIDRGETQQYPSTSQGAYAGGLTPGQGPAGINRQPAPGYQGYQGQPGGAPYRQADPRMQPGQGYVELPSPGREQAAAPGASPSNAVQPAVAVGNRGLAQPMSGQREQLDWNQARTAAAQIGMAVGGLQMFPTDYGNSAPAAPQSTNPPPRITVGPARQWTQPGDAPMEALASGAAQANSPQYGVPQDNRQQPGTQYNSPPTNAQPNAQRQPPAAYNRMPVISPAPAAPVWIEPQIDQADGFDSLPAMTVEEQAELDRLSEQARQLEQQIRQRRQQLDSRGAQPQSAQPAGGPVVTPQPWQGP